MSLLAISRKSMDRPMHNNIHLDPNEPKPLDKRFRVFFKGYWHHQAKCRGDLDEDMRRYMAEESDVLPTHKRKSLANVYHPTTPFQIWAYRISLVLAIAILISMFFIPYPANLILFIVSLLAFLLISCLLHIRAKRQATNSGLNGTLPRHLSRDHSFVDVPLEPISISEGSYDPPLISTVS